MLVLPCMALDRSKDGLDSAEFHGKPRERCTCDYTDYADKKLQLITVWLQ